jgi:hypothetical protein
VRRGFLTHLDLHRVGSLDELNRLLWAWIEGHYHASPHRGLEGEAPLDRWLRLSDGLRPIPAAVDLDELFLEQTTRTVAKDGTFSLKGRCFEAGPEWIGQRIIVHFDPFDLRAVLISGLDGDSHPAFPVDLEGNRRVRRTPPPEPTKPKGPSIELKALENLADQMDPPDDKEQDHE